MEDFRILEQRFTAIRDQLEHGVYHVIDNLRIEGYTSREPLPFARRTEGEYRLLQPGEHWGELFDCGWFHFTGCVPASASGETLAVLVDLSAEGLIVDKNGDPVQGMTSATSRNEFPLGLWGKRTIELQDCLNEHGQIDFWGDFTCMDIEGQYRNQGRIKEACLASVDTLVRDCFYDWQVCQSLFVGLCENGDPYGAEVGSILEKAAALFGDGDAQQTSDSADTQALMLRRHAYSMDDTQLDLAGERLSVWPDPETEPTRKRQLWLDAHIVHSVRDILQELLSRPAENYSMEYASVGHSHLDLLFLWPVRETPRKCARTMSTVMKMMDRYPEYKFTLSQAPVYIWLKEQYPTLYEKMCRRIREGRLEAVGALYIECDTNLPSGESLVRQLLYGKRFFQKELGQDMKVGFLPDVFGYSAALPQLFVKAGVPYFTTNKLSMNDTNRFPRYTFWWQGMDGTRILTHMLPENSYTSASVPQMAIYGEHHYTDKELCPVGLQLYGLGDGGGGPGYEHMERRKRARNLKGCPPLHDEFVVDFFKRIEKNANRYKTWQGELYFERHQGTYTSMAEQKKWNRTLERDLHLVEWLSALCHGSDGFSYPHQWLTDCWQDVLLYQFHDCLPGSAIDRVYAQTQARYALRHEQAREIADTCLKILGSRLDTASMQRPLLVANPTAFPRTERVERDGTEMAVTLQPYEVRAVDLAAGRRCDLVAAENRLENEYVSVIFEADGTVSSVYDKRLGREMLSGRGNVLKLYPDENTHWDIEKAYLSEPGVQATLLSMHAEKTDLRQELHMELRVGNSHIRQTVSLEAHSPRVDFSTQVEWQEEYRMLRVSWPVDVVTEHAACEIQFGHINRPTHRNTSWDEAKFEVCAHKWADMSDRNGGLALLNDCKYGYKLWDRTLDLCLLRSQNCPCEHGDLGVHRFTYAIVAHGADVWDGDVIRQGYLLNYPPEIRELPRSVGTQLLPIAQVTAGTAVLETVKMAHDSEELILRLYEAAGGATTACLKLNGYEPVCMVDLIENPISSDDLRITADAAYIHFHAFEVQSLKIRKIKPQEEKL